MVIFILEIWERIKTGQNKETNAKRYTNRKEREKSNCWNRH